MRMRHVAASGVAGLIIILMPLCEADAGLWCPTPIPGVLMKYCLCESITGRAEVSSPTPLSPLTLFALRRDFECDSNAGLGGPCPSARRKAQISFAQLVVVL
jgi:hypothetical protein